MKIWVVRVFGPAVAKVTNVRLLLTFTGSSLMRDSRQTAETFGSPLTPIAHEASMTRKKRAVEAVLTRL
jgi:hypothetical protein